MRFRKKSRRRKARSRRAVNSYGFVMRAANPKKKRRRARKRRAAPRRARRARPRRTTRTVTRTIVRQVNAPRRKRRRRRSNPSAALVLRRRPRHHLRRRRRNPEGLIRAVFVKGLWHDTVKPNWAPAAVAGGFDLFVMDPLVARLAKPIQGPVKAVLYPILTGLISRLLLKSSPRASAFLGRVAVFGFAFGVKDTIARFTGAPQAAMGDLADAWARRSALQAAQQRQLAARNGMRFIPTAQRGMQYIPARNGMGYIPASGMGGGNPYARQGSGMRR